MKVWKTSEPGWQMLGSQMLRLTRCNGKWRTTPTKKWNRHLDHQHRVCALIRLLQVKRKIGAAEGGEDVEYDSFGDEVARPEEDQKGKKGSKVEHHFNTNDDSYLVNTLPSCYRSTVAFFIPVFCECDTKVIVLSST